MNAGLSPPTLAALRAAGLEPDHVADLVTRALDEDLDGGVDVTSVAAVPFDEEGTADFVSRAAGVVAGLPVVRAVLDIVSDDAVDCVQHVDDGDRVGPGAMLLTASAQTRALLTAERTALNVLCHLSGVATVTRQWVDAVAGTSAVIRDTRKTTPGLRQLEKYAVRCGGGMNHRMSLADAALIKDNHVLAAHGVSAAFDAVRTTFPDIPVEVECDTLDQVAEAVEAGADLILLDNMSTDDMVKAVEIAAGRARLEASGGLSLDGARVIAETGVDYLAVGALTHSATILDIGVDLRRGT
ncbi:MAG: carboxylating nicotinate-nucleotide diphosphorylase [Actinomycetes bacterium]